MKSALLFCSGMIVAALLTVMAWRDLRTTREAESTVRELAAERVAAEKTRTALEQRIAAAEKKRDTLRQPRTVAPAKPANAAAQPMPSVADQLGSDPKLQALFFAGMRNQIAINYGPFFRSAGLTSEQIVKLENALIKQAEQNMDIEMAARSQGVASNSPEIAELRKKSGAETQAEERDALGDTTYAQFKDYERSAAVREVVQGLVGTSVLEGVPLTPQQGEQVGQVLANASPSYRMGGKVSYEDIDWAAAQDGLRSVLSDAQFDLFHSLEPLGGGASRFGAALSTTFAQAMRAEHGTAPDNR